MVNNRFVLFLLTAFSFMALSASVSAWHYTYYDGYYTTCCPSYYSYYSYPVYTSPAYYGPVVYPTYYYAPSYYTAPYYPVYYPRRWGFFGYYFG